MQDNAGVGGRGSGSASNVGEAVDEREPVPVVEAAEMLRVGMDGRVGGTTRFFFAVDVEETGFRIERPSVPKTLLAGFLRAFLTGVLGTEGREEVSVSPGSVTESFPGSKGGSSRGKTDVLLDLPFHQVPIQSPNAFRSDFRGSKGTVGDRGSSFGTSGRGPTSSIASMLSVMSGIGSGFANSGEAIPVVLSLSAPFDTVVTDGAYRLSRSSTINLGNGVASSSASVSESAKDYRRKFSPA